MLLGRWLVLCKPGRDLVSGMQPQLLEHVTHVGSDGVLGERELRGYLAVGEPMGHERRHLLLSAGELARRFAGRWLRRHRGRERIGLLLGEGVLYGLFERQLA